MTEQNDDRTDAVELRTTMRGIELENHIGELIDAGLGSEQVLAAFLLQVRVVQLIEAAAEASDDDFHPVVSLIYTTEALRAGAGAPEEGLEEDSPAGVVDVSVPERDRAARINDAIALLKSTYTPASAPALGDGSTEDMGLLFMEKLFDAVADAIELLPAALVVRELDTLIEQYVDDTQD